MKDKIIKHLKENYILLLFVLCAVCMEMTAVYVTSGKILLRHPGFYFSLLAIITVIQLFFRTNRARHIYSSLILAVFFVCDLIFIIIYEMTGTVFDFSMLNLRGDAMAILESVPINFTYTAVSGIILSAFIVFGNAFDTGTKFKSFTPKFKRILSASLAVVIVLHISLAYTFVATANTNEDNIQKKLYKNSSDGYSDMGILGTFLSEMYQSAFKKVNVGDTSEINSFIYQNVAGDEIKGFGSAKDYNVITVLGESFEWFSFMRNEAVYPNGHKASEKDLRELYPNLYRLYDSSCVMTNFHSREKTDISENLSIIGNYPLDYYLNYDYTYNNIAYSLPNIMRDLYSVKSNSFHNGTSSFYNRSEYLPNAAGFNSFTASEEMKNKGMTNYYETGERNLDSEMIEVCKKEMFPTDRRFYTYITTITMHGQYAYRSNLEPYYKKLDKKGILPLQSGPQGENANTFRYYAAAAMEFDKSIGVILDYLEETGLDKNTVLAVFGDHNVYYQSLSNYVKNIYPKANPESDITELYRVPLIIKIGDQNKQIKIDKFTCTADIMPTIMSLLGIRYYSNLYYGHSVFDSRESLLYSRAYNVFMTDKIYFNTLNSITYESALVSKEYYRDVEQRAIELMNKTAYVNRIFAADFFTGENLKIFKNNMKKINS